MFLNIDKHPSNHLAAIEDYGASITYGELCIFVQEIGQIIPPRSFIFILAENSIGSLCGYMGALSNKIVPIILSAHMDQQALNKLYHLYQPEYIWLPESLTLEFNLQTIWKKMDFHLQKTRFGNKQMYEELSLLLPTSGSTGSSKLVRHSYRNIEKNACNVATFFNLTQNERPLVTLPMHYTMGLSVIASHLLVGATLLMMKGDLLDPMFWNFVREQQATSFTGVPFSFEILKKIRFFRMDLPHLKLITQGGGKMSNELFRNCAEYAVQTGKKFIATYGQTEGTARMTYLPPQLATHKTSSIGRAIPEGKIILIDSQGKEIQKMEAEGEMVYMGPNVTLGYAIHPNDLSKEDENQGILHTGDMVRRDVDGCLYIIGRLGRFLKLFGFRVGLDECEQLVRSKFQTECACVGDDNGMKIFITDCTYKEEIPLFLSHKTNIIPSVFSVKVLDKIPRNEAGKTAYSQLTN